MIFRKPLRRSNRVKPLTGKDGVLTPLIKNLAEAALEGELDAHLGQKIAANRKNGKSKKTTKTLNGSFELETPLDRTGTFKPRLIKKHQTTLNDQIEEKILALYGFGMSYKDISAHLEDIYGIEASKGTLTAITDKIIHTVKEWHARALESIYPIVWLDAIHYKIREDCKVHRKAIYTILDVNIDGRKKVLGLSISENEGANFWLQVLTDLSNRGIGDILIACSDSLKGFPEAIETIFPKKEVQLCIVHQNRNTLEYVGSKNQKEFMVDLKRVYKATNKDLAESELDKLEDK